MQLTLNHKKETIQFTVEYRRRKTMEIRIIPPDNILVVCPKGLSKDKIIQLVNKKADWIVKKLEVLKDVKHELADIKLEDGVSLMYLGHKYPLQIKLDKPINKPNVQLIKGRLRIITPVNDDEKIRKALINWYKEKANEKVKERVEYYKHRVGKEPGIVKAKKQKRIWGSCTSKGNLYFNWRIIMAPNDIIDYVVVHELCHLVHMNHSKNFWKLVETILPDYKDRRLWLKKFGITLNI